MPAPRRFAPTNGDYIQLGADRYWPDYEGLCTAVSPAVAAAMAAAGHQEVIQSSVSGGGGTPVLAPIASRINIPTVQLAAASYRQLQCASWHTAMDDISTMTLIFPGFFLKNPIANSGISEVVNAGNTTLNVSVEYPIGTFTRVTFGGGSSTGTIPSGTNLTSDALAMSIPRGKRFRIRVFQQTASGSLAATLSNTSAYGEACDIQLSGLTDNTMGGTINNTLQNFTYQPCAILGMTSRMTWALFGDSRAAGAADTVSDQYLLMGEIERVLGLRWAVLNLANSGEKATDAANGKAARRIALAKACNIKAVWSEYGINDLVGLRNTGQIVADLSALKVQMGVSLPFWASTVAPVSSSTDSWATTGNQTAATWDAERIAYNTAIRTGMGGVIDGYAEVSDSMETARGSGIWKAPGYTTDGTHGLKFANEIAQQSFGWQSLQSVA